MYCCGKNLLTTTIPLPITATVFSICIDHPNLSNITPKSLVPSTCSPGNPYTDKFNYGLCLSLKCIQIQYFLL